MTERMTGVEIAARLIADNSDVIRGAVRALETRDRYALEPREWEVFYLVREVVAMAHGLIDSEATTYLKIVTGRV